AVHIVVALGKIGPHAKEAGPYLVDLIKNSKQDQFHLKMHALQSLSQIGVTGKEAPSAIFKMIPSAPATTRLMLLEALSRAGGLDKDAIPALQQGLRDRDPLVR